MLPYFNLRLETLTAARQEEHRLAQVKDRGDFDRPVYAEPPGLRSERFREILNALPEFRPRFDSFQNAVFNDVSFELSNSYFGSPDAEVLYAMVRLRQPARVLEIGCGHSTKVIHQAVLDGRFPCKHTCIDPRPRQDITNLADDVVCQPIEAINPADLASQLRDGDIVFIDTSHELRPANDVAFIYGRLLPLAPAGVIVHIHDIFLPYEYPQDWIVRMQLNWAEQYLVHALMLGGGWEALWPGYYLQRTFPGFGAHFPHLTSGSAQSLWLRKL